MTGGEAQAAWRLFAINWRLLALLALVLAVSFAISGFSFGLGGALVSYGFVALYGAFAYYNAKAAHRRDPQVVYVLGCTGQIIFATCILAPLSYVAAAANLPLQDANLHAIDRALGLDWQAYVAFVSARPLLARWLALGYTMIQWPIFFIPVVLAATSRYRRLQDFILAFTLAPGGNRLHFGLCRGDRVFHHLGLAVTDFPNIDGGAYLAQLKELPLVRDGSLRRLELFGLGGLVTFPSFHAASAALYAWALWPVRWFRPIAIVSNAAMLAATPIEGGHYFIDIIAGIAIAALAIAAARWLSRRSAPRIVTAEISISPAPAPVASSAIIGSHTQS